MAEEWPPITTVRIRVYKDELGIWNADSEDVFGLNLCSRTRRELLAAIPHLIERLYLLNQGLRVIAKPAVEPSAFSRRISTVVPDRYVLEAQAAPAQ